jgi:hypothetical protein
VVVTFLSGVVGIADVAAVKTSPWIGAGAGLAVVDERGTILGMTTSSYAPTGLLAVRALSRGVESPADGATVLGEGDAGAAMGGGMGLPGDAVAVEPEGDGRTLADLRSEQQYNALSVSCATKERWS